MQFDAFAGNRKIIERLRIKLREGRFPHALIFSGPAGVGKHTVALMLAKGLNCNNAGTPGDFCDECVSCRKIGSGTHPDVTTITVEEDAAEIKIGQIRQLLSVLNLKPLEGRNKVFIIDPAEKMNPSAANALLKGLEEPPESTFFFLITVNVHELLLTVRSRSQVYNFTPLTIDDLRKHGITDELTLRWSQGSIGRALSLDMARLKSERELVMDFLDTVLAATPDEFHDLVGVSAELSRVKQEFESRIGILAVLIADLLYIAEATPEKIVNVDIRDRLQKCAARAPSARLLPMADFLRVIESGLKGHANRQILTDVLSVTPLLIQRT